MATAVHIDVEVYSEVNLAQVGTPVYAAHPSTEVLAVSWAVDEGPVVTWEPRRDPDTPDALLALLEDDAVLVHAFNMAFEAAIFRGVLGLEIPLTRQRCTMVLGLSLSLPASLEKMGSAIGLPLEKAKLINGKRLIRMFCQPRKPTQKKPWPRCTADTDPEAWAEFLTYNRQDVVAERAIHQRLAKWDLSADAWADWRLDQTLNARGLPIDQTLVDNARRVADANKRRLLDEARTLTGLENPNSVPQLLAWLQTQGLTLNNLNKHTVASLLQTDLQTDPQTNLTDTVRQVLEIRQQLGKGSLAKFEALARATSADGRLRNSLQFYGAARTGRWAGRVFQPQNLPRGHLNAAELHDTVAALRQGTAAPSMDALASCIRAAVRAPDGQRLTVADLANVESRIVAWLADCRYLLDVFAAGEDFYRHFAAELFQCPLAEVDRAQRNTAKPPALGCPYGLGAQGLKTYAEGMFVSLTPDQAQHAVDVFRRTCHEVVTLWRRLERAAMATIADGRTRTVGRLRFVYDTPFLFLVLPSGRKLAYLHPRVEKQPAPWGELIDQVTYMGTDQYTRQWTRLNTFGGKWVEQACQAISRDLLAHGMAEAERLGIAVVGHTHDELIALTDEHDWRDAEVLSHCMTRTPHWADETLYLAADGFEDVIYRKAA